VLGYVLLLFASFVCLAPFAALLSASFSSERAILMEGYGLLPKEFSTEAYRLLFANISDVLAAYGVSIFVTAVGAVSGLFVIALTAYVLSRNYFKYRFQFTFFFYFTTLFNGGLLSTYIFFVRYLNLKNNLLALILPPMLNVFYLLIMRSFISALPESICESAKMDGAHEFVIFTRLILPLSTPALATIGLFLILDYWNDWYHAMLYIADRDKFPLQYMLYNMLSASEALARISSRSNVSMVQMPSNATRMAMTVIATGPIVLVYPFVQKYFVKGITLGAVKG
jgi:putative aldouronate transport system permease protein